MTSIQIYFDPVSPYAWLAMRDLGRVTETGARVTWTAILFAGLLDAHGNLGPAEIPVKRRYLARDVAREAARRGLPFAGPPGHPFNSLLALRMCTAVEDNEARGRLALALTAACWERGADISDEHAARQVADEAGFDGAALASAARTDGIKGQLTAATKRAAADGIFGVPTFRVDGEDELFWGADRIETLLWRLHGHTVDEAAVEAFLARPPLATRTR